MSEKMTSEENRTSVMDMNMSDFDQDSVGMETSHNMDFLLDIPLEITVELGSSKITIGDLLKLSQGSVVELNKLTDEPLDIYVNKKLMAHGEVVVVNEKFGIRLTNILSPGERVKGLT